MKSEMTSGDACRRINGGGEGYSEFRALFLMHPFRRSPEVISIRGENISECEGRRSAAISGSYTEMSDNYTAERRRLMTEMQAEIIDTDRKISEYSKTHGAGKYALVLIFFAFIMNVIFFAELPNYSLFWVVASFLLLMFNPIILMLPTQKADIAFPSGKENGGFTDLVRDAAASAGTAVTRERKLYAETLWNLFFINCQPIAPGFILLFSVSIILALIGLITGFFELRSAVILIVQSLAIIAFYSGILKIKPYSPGFFSGIMGIRTDISRRLNQGIANGMKFILILAFLAAISGVLILGVLLLPGQSLSSVMRIEGFVALGPNAIPLLLVFLSQLLVVRYFQGIYSRKLVLELSEYNHGLLQNTLLSGIRALPETPGEEAEKELETISKAYTRLHMFKVDDQAFAGYFPVWMIVPNLDVMIQRAPKKENP
ncbi:hypothetical protein L1S32_00505 [Methanogenium sp. S4BF]|uniref:hypothetical protein n=1 Tax=Methanogenium sp. S4BF TaxID=1789226 RepID=UPI002416C4EC|nr:hypothetical protein [Methanogenium sp. S4BF]WFN34636.1 hypothetical protein L1S32_00505 [Methanogenium sp. S4BF]